MINFLCPKTLLLFLLLPMLCLGQGKYNSGEITYGVDLDPNLIEETEPADKKGQEFFKKTVNRAKQSAAGITCVLKFNSKTAQFLAEEGLENDADNGYDMARTFLDVDGPYYIDLTAQEILQEREAFGKTYLVEESFDTRNTWTITSEKKQIGGYTVYKATTVKVVTNSKATFESDVIAWFAPEIPYSFGPVGYGGLPGLILELVVESNFQPRYFVKSVKFSEEEHQLEVPSGVKKITAGELDDMYRKARGNMRNF